MPVQTQQEPKPPVKVTRSPAVEETLERGAKTVSGMVGMLPEIVRSQQRWQFKGIQSNLGPFQAPFSDVILLSEIPPS